MRITPRAVGLLVVGLLCAVAIVVVVIHSKGAKEQRSTTTTVVPNVASIVPTVSDDDATKAAIAKQLQPFLQEYFTIIQNETEEQRHNRVAKLVTSDMASQLNWEFAGVPPGSTMTSRVDMSNLQVQTGHTVGQIYVIVPVTATVDKPGGTEFGGLTYNTGSVWQQDSTNPTRWTIVHFSYDLVGG